jgi:outer membrane protein assembly factor BamB
VAQDNERIGPRIFHCSWSSPALGVVNGQKLVFFCGGDGICYAFKALDNSLANSGEVTDLERVWKFDCDPAAPKEDVHSFVGNHRVSPSNVKSMPVFHNNRVYVTCGGDVWWGKDKSWLKCIDATLQGDITQSGQLWSVPLKQHACTTPCIVDGLVFVGDCRQRERTGNVYCVDADTGELLWSDPTKGSIWASPMAADGKVYVGTRQGELRIYTTARKMKMINEVLFEDPIGATVTPANGRLYVATLSQLFAIERAD